MKRILLTAAFLLAASSASAEWVKVIELDDKDVYAEPSRIRTEGNFVKFWIMESFKTPQQIGGIKFSTVIRRFEMNCKNENNRVIGVAFYSGKEGQGEIIFKTDEAGDWKNIIPGSLGDGYFEILCLKKNPAG